METDAFDRATRALTDRRSRRGALVGMLGGVLGVPLIPAHMAHAKKKPCPPCKKRKKGKCKATLPDGTACASGTCREGECVASPVSPPSPPPPPPTVAPVCGQGGPCLVFLSSSLHDPDFGGLSAGDAICQNLATAAGLSGRFKAWLSDSTGAASSRFVPSSGPYKLVNGTTIATNWDDLRDGELRAPINVTETGGDAGGWFGVVTGTQPNGAAGTANCANWTTASAPATGVIGVATTVDERWTAYGAAPCENEQSFHLYCFQQG
jgi:hypothetical protein